jgi:hypothetical protein
MPLKISPEPGPGMVPVPGKRRKVKVTIKKKRLDLKAIAIQSSWRGHQIRKTIEQILQKKKTKQKNKISFSKGGDQVIVSDPISNAEEEKLEKFRKIPFDQLSRVQFYIDCAVGLPENCTITRVSGRLLRPDRTEVSSVGTVEAISDPRSSATDPAINLFLSWKGILSVSVFF